MCQHEFFGNFLATDWVFTGQLQVYFVRDTVRVEETFATFCELLGGCLFMEGFVKGPLMCQH